MRLEGRYESGEARSGVVVTGGLAWAVADQEQCSLMLDIDRERATSSIHPIHSINRLTAINTYHLYLYLFCCVPPIKYTLSAMDEDEIDILSTTPPSSPSASTPKRQLTLESNTPSSSSSTSPAKSEAVTSERELIRQRVSTSKRKRPSKRSASPSSPSKSNKKQRTDATTTTPPAATTSLSSSALVRAIKHPDENRPMNRLIDCGLMDRSRSASRLSLRSRRCA